MSNMNIMVNSIPGLDDVTDRTCDGKCSRCGSCCTEHLSVTRREVEDIRRWLADHPDYQPHHLSWMTGHNVVAICPFHNPDTGLCDIYDVRPFVCRDFICCRKRDKLEKKRLLYAQRADFNSFLDRDQKMISFHALFFKDYRFDILYRHLAIKLVCEKVGRIPPKFEDEAKLFPMLVDDLMKGGDNR